MAISHVALLKFYLAIEILGPFFFAMDLFNQAVECANLMPPREQFATNSAADETSATRDKYFLHGQSPAVSMQIAPKGRSLCCEKHRQRQQEHLLLPHSSTNLIQLNGR
jgi:hypothetical protein